MGIPNLEIQDVLIAIILGTIMMVMVSEYETKAVQPSLVVFFLQEAGLDFHDAVSMFGESLSPGF